MPEIVQNFNVLTALALQELDITNVQTDKCQEIKRQLEHFYIEQTAAAATTTATPVQGGKSPLSVDYFMVNIFIFLALFSILLCSFLILNFTLQILHDKAFAHPIHRLIMSRNKYQHGPTYLLRFDFESTYSLLKRICVGEKIPGKRIQIDLRCYALC